MLKWLTNDRAPLTAISLCSVNADFLGPDKGYIHNEAVFCTVNSDITIETRSRCVSLSSLGHPVSAELSLPVESSHVSSV